MAAPAPQAPIVNLNMILDQVAKDKGIERAVLVDTLQSAIAQAAKRHFGQDRSIEATYNEEKGVVEVFQTLTVVEQVEIMDPVKSVNQISLEDARRKGIEADVGDELLFQIFYRPEDEEEARVQDERYGDILRLKTYRKSFGRIAAQTAKQVVLDRLRAAEREVVFEEYAGREGDIISGAVARAGGLRTVAHAGEAAGAQSVRAAVEVLQADRIGHGVRAVEDARVVELLAQRRIPLEICPTSNLHTQVVKDVAELKGFIEVFRRHGVRFSINTDGPEMLQTTLRDELKLAVSAGLVSRDELAQCGEWAVCYPHLPLPTIYPV